VHALRRRRHRCRPPERQRLRQSERLTAKAILDRAIDALTVDGKVVLSDQHLASGNDDPPPATADGEQKPVADRVADARAALGLSAAKS
jgi:hypothetical protein